MHVLRVISSMNPAAGGPCQGIRNSIPALAELGVNTEVVSSDAPGSDWLGTDSFPIHALGPGKYGYAYSPRLLPWLIENLLRFDAVIIHGLWLWPSIATHVAMRKLETGNLKAERITQVSGLESQLSALSSSSTSPNNQEPITNNSKQRVPRCFVMPHGMLDPYFQRAPERRAKAIRNWIYWKLIEHRVINGADGVLFTCEEEKRLAREPFRPYRPKREIVVNYGTPEPPPYVPAMRDAIAAACPDLGDQPYILFLGRIHPKKGVEMLIRAYARVKAENLSQVSSPLNDQPSTINCRRLPALVIAGPCHDPAYLGRLKELSTTEIQASHEGTKTQRVTHHTKQSGESSVEIGEIRGSENVSANLKAEIGKLKPENLSQVSSFKAQVSPSPSIHFVDMISGDTKWGALYGCEAFILPSHQENFGIAVAEALACNKPVLISNKVNIWREIEADGAGIVEDDTDEGTENLLRRFCNEWRFTSNESNPPATGNSPPATSHPSPSTRYPSPTTRHPSPYSCFKQRFSIEQAAESLLCAITS